MFSYTVGSLCNLVLFSLAVEKLFILMRSHLFLSFMFLALGDILVKILLCGISEIFLPMFFSSRTFIVSRLIVKSFIHLEFIFMYGVVGDQASFFCM